MGKSNKEQYARILGLAPIAQPFKKSAWIIYLISDKAPPVTRDSNEVARTLNRCCHRHTENGGLCGLPGQRHRGLTNILTCPLKWENGKVSLTNPLKMKSTRKVSVCQCVALTNF